MQTKKRYKNILRYKRVIKEFTEYLKKIIEKKNKLIN